MNSEFCFFFKKICERRRKVKNNLLKICKLKPPIFGWCSYHQCKKVKKMNRDVMRLIRYRVMEQGSGRTESWNCCSFSCAKRLKEYIKRYHYKKPPRLPTRNKRLKEWPHEPEEEIQVAKIFLPEPASF